MRINCGQQPVEINKIKSIGFYDDRVELDLTDPDGSNHKTLKFSYDDFSVFFVILVNQFNHMEKH